MSAKAETRNAAMTGVKAQRDARSERRRRSPKENDEMVFAVLAKAGDGAENADLCDVGGQPMQDAQRDCRLARVALW